MAYIGPYSHIAMDNGETHRVQGGLTTVLAALNARDVVIVRFTDVYGHGVGINPTEVVSVIEPEEPWDGRESLAS